MILSASKDIHIVACPRNLILLGANSHATVIETYAGWAPDVTFVNAATEVVVGPAAVLEHYKVQRESERAFHFGTMTVDQERDSSVTAHSMSFGGSLSRNNVSTIFRGQGGSLTLNGIFMPRETQQHDNYTRIDHVAPSCTSVELYRGILDGRSRGVFNGDMYVRKDGKQTVARRENQHLLLSQED